MRALALVHWHIGMILAAIIAKLTFVALTWFQSGIF